MNEIILTGFAIQGLFLGNIQVLQATLNSTGIDWIVWPILLIAAWCILLVRTTTILKILSLPTITISTYFVLFIAYKTIFM